MHIINARFFVHWLGLATPFCNPFSLRGWGSIGAKDLGDTPRTRSALLREHADTVVLRTSIDLAWLSAS
jgi:hypothetical protein